MIDKRNVFTSNLSRTSRNKSFQLAFFPWQPHFVIKELHWLWKVLELKPSANRDPGARPHERRPERKAGKTDGANESGGRRPLFLERQGRTKIAHWDNLLSLEWSQWPVPQSWCRLRISRFQGACLSSCFVKWHWINPGILLCNSFLYKLTSWPRCALKYCIESSHAGYQRSA